MPLYIDSTVSNMKIPIPPDLPDIMKQFTKAAIRTQPRDVLQWSAAYFQAMAKGESPPVKERIEFSSSTTSAWITLGLLRVLHRQLGDKDQVSQVQIQNNWSGLCLDPSKLEEVMQAGNFSNRIHWITFLSVACNLATSSIADALRLFCEVVTSEPEGCPARVPYSLVSHAYLVILDRVGGVNPATINDFLQYLADCASNQDNCVHPGNMLSPSAPPIA